MILFSEIFTKIWGGGGGALVGEINGGVEGYLS